MSVSLRLRARTERIDDPGDLLRALSPGGFTWLGEGEQFVTAGRVATLPADAVHSALAAIDGDPGRVRAVGTLPFRGEPFLHVPARIVARDADGQVWRTVIEGSAPLDTPAPPHRPSSFRVTATGGHDAYVAAVAAALALIEHGALAKVVLAREVVVEADAAFDVPTTLRRLRSMQPGCTVYADGAFVGASPELLLRRRGRSVLARPLAGTATDAAWLARSAKDAREHEFVVVAVADVLGRVCSDVVTDGPAAMTFADVVHFATSVRGRLRDGECSALDVARLLHPTPAVAGTPCDVALETIAHLEPFDRGRYAGACGWVDGNGDGEFVVALRCAQLDGPVARLYAGAGIVAGSDPEAEWAETQVKLDPMLRALVRP